MCVNVGEVVSEWSMSQLVSINKKNKTKETYFIQTELSELRDVTLQCTYTQD